MPFVPTSRDAGRGLMTPSGGPVDAAQDPPRGERGPPAGSPRGSPEETGTRALRRTIVKPKPSPTLRSSCAWTSSTCGSSASSRRTPGSAIARSPNGSAARRPPSARASWPSRTPDPAGGLGGRGRAKQDRREARRGASRLRLGTAEGPQLGRHGASCSRRPGVRSVLARARNGSKNTKGPRDEGGRRRRVETVPSPVRYAGGFAPSPGTAECAPSDATTRTHAPFPTLAPPWRPCASLAVTPAHRPERIVAARGARGVVAVMPPRTMQPRRSATPGRTFIPPHPSSRFPARCSQSVESRAHRLNRGGLAGDTAR